MYFSQQVVREVKHLETGQPSEREVVQGGYGVVTEVEAGQLLLEPEGQFSYFSYLVA